MTPIKQLAELLPPGWALRENARKVLLSYRGWVIAKYTPADSPERIAREVHWHTTLFSDLRDVLAKFN